MSAAFANAYLECQALALSGGIGETYYQRRHHREQAKSWFFGDAEGPVSVQSVCNVLSLDLPDLRDKVGDLLETPIPAPFKSSRSDAVREERRFAAAYLDRYGVAV